MKFVKCFAILCCFVLASCASKKGTSHNQYQEAQMTPVMQVPAGYVKPSEPSYPIPALKTEQTEGKTPSLLPPGINPQ